MAADSIFPHQARAGQNGPGPSAAAAVSRGRTGEAAVQIDVQQCLNYRGRQVSCNRCDDICPAAAVSPGIDSVNVNPEMCTGCGACVPACPSGAVALAGFDPRVLVEALAQSKRIRIRCSRSGYAGFATEVACLQVLDARLLAAAGAAGMQAVTLHGLDRCPDCTRGDGRKAVKKICDDLMQWLGDAAPAVRIADPDPPGPAVRLPPAPRYNRRNFLRLAALQAADNALPQPLIAKRQDTRPPPLAAGKPGHRPAAYQELFAAAIPALDWRAGQLPLHDRTINPACNMCLVCSERCPTGALSVREQGRSIALLLQPGLCTDCGLCERLCPAGAIARAGLVDARAVAGPPGVVMQLPRNDCDCCGKKFIAATGDEKRCQSCMKEQAIRSDWLGTV